MRIRSPKYSVKIIVFVSVAARGRRRNDSGIEKQAVVIARIRVVPARCVLGAVARQIYVVENAADLTVVRIVEYKRRKVVIHIVGAMLDEGACLARVTLEKRRISCEAWQCLLNFSGKVR